VRDATLYAHPALTHLPEAEWCPRKHWTADVPVEAVLDNGVAPKAEAVEVYANHGRWIVECSDCHSAQLASRTDLRFMCDCCANAAIGCLWRPVIWPKEHVQIEAVLSERPKAANRNWAPGEKLRDLRAENVERLGLGA
jgi:hypothetical protein